MTNVLLVKHLVCTNLLILGRFFVFEVLDDLLFAECFNADRRVFVLVVIAGEGAVKYVAFGTFVFVGHTFADLAHGIDIA
jgi:hypothetical protein